MVRQSQEANPQQEVSRREARAHRILDAAAALIMRWGYQKTTLDDVAKQAGVAKGTMYLHWRTREDLFGALIKREKLAMTDDLRQRIIADPEGATLRGIVKHSALALVQRPLLKAFLLLDIDVVGKLAYRSRSGADYMERFESFKAYFAVLREHGLIRTDLSLEAQMYMFSAIFTGYYLVNSLIPHEFQPSDEEMAELIAETVHCTLESNRSAPTDELKMVSDNLIQYFDRATEMSQEQFRKDLEG